MSFHNRIDASSFCLFAMVLEITLHLLHCFIEQVQLLPRRGLILVRIQRTLHRLHPFSLPLEGLLTASQIALLASQLIS